MDTTTRSRSEQTLLLALLTLVTACTYAADASAPAASPMIAPAAGTRVWISEVRPPNGNYYQACQEQLSWQGGDTNLQAAECPGNSDSAIQSGDAIPKGSWLELLNLESQEVDLQGWSLVLVGSNGVEKPLAQLPQPLKLPPGGITILSSKWKDAAAAAACDSQLQGSATPLHKALKALIACNGTSLGSALVLKRPDGSVASSIGPGVPRLPVNTSWGMTQSFISAARSKPEWKTPVLAAASAAQPLYTVTTASPGNDGGVALQSGPAILGLDCQLPVQPLPGTDLMVNAALSPNGVAKDVTLMYQVNYGAIVPVQMKQLGSIGADGSVKYQGFIPQGAFASGQMVRWFVTVKDGAGGVIRAPFEDNQGALSCGTVIGPQAGQDNPGVPVLEWFSPYRDQALTEKGSHNGSIFYAGQFYDGISTHRRGVTSLTHPKPKLAFKLPDKLLQYLSDRPAVGKFNLQSFWFELGERSYMKEPLALQAFALAGVKSPTSFHVNVRCNGAFFGLFSFVEVIDDTFLKRYGLDSDGPLIKAVSGELSNLRWDLPVGQMQFYYTKGNRKKHQEDWNLLHNFTVSLAGGGAEPRSKYIFDYVELPQVINEMAAQTLVLNMDRCTKNFYMYQEPGTQRWYRFPWDLDASFGQDNGLGGKPGNTYCVLACEQWNNPLYCDSEHTQDLQKTTPWGVVTVTFGDTYAQSASTRNRLLAAAAQAPALGTKGYPKPQGWSTPDNDLSKQASITGVPGTYNYLTDILLDVEPTRMMYLRRLRTLTDKLFVSGKIAQIANETYMKIKQLADQDAQLWRTGIDVQRGYQQITLEFLPTRTQQLISEYGPNGTYPLLPGPQLDRAKLYVRKLVIDPSYPAYDYLELVNVEDYAVDASDWKIQGAVEFAFAPGTVVPPRSSVYVAQSIAGFRSRPTSPQGGAGLLYVAPMSLKYDRDSDVYKRVSSSDGKEHEIRLVNTEGQVLERVDIRQV